MCLIPSLQELSPKEASEWGGNMSFKKFDGSTWQSITPKQLKGIPYTGTLPATLTDTKAGYLHKYKIYGNTEQIGTPTPENPIMPSECGELETTGVHAGQYKLPLTSAGQGVDIYIGESQTTRRIKKLVLTGDEGWIRDGATGVFDLRILNALSTSTQSGISSHWAFEQNRGVYTLLTEGHGCIRNAYSSLWIRDNNFPTVADFKAYLAAQYANGTPVTVWYVLATEETGTLNEPLRKIGDYADTIDSTQTTAQIPTSAGSTTIGWAGEGLAPSEFDSIREWVDIPTYTYTNGAWVADN